MCIAIYKMCGNELPTKERLQNCFNANGDGAGFSYSYKGTVYTYKGYFSFDKFYNKLMECDRKYNLKEQGVLIHCRIKTHGELNASNTHPFALTSNEHKLKATFSKSRFSVVHNGVSIVTSDASKKEKLSDTALFVRDYLSKIATYDGWFDNPHTISLIEQLIQSKMAILRGDGAIIATDGFHQADGCYYSNRSYEPNYGYYGYGYGYFDDWYNDYYSGESQYELPLMQLKPNEAVVYEDGEVEDYRFDYHNTFRTFVSPDGEVYIALDDEFEDEIPFSHLSYVGNGTIVDNFFPTCADGLRPIPFRKDAVAVL